MVRPGSSPLTDAYEGPIIRSRTAAAAEPSSFRTLRKERFMLTNTAIEDQVLSALALDPRIPDPVEIAVSAESDTVTLRGTVESFGQRRAAAQDAREIDGVVGIDDQL